MVVAHIFISAFQPSPGFLGHGGVERLAELETCLLGDTFMLGQGFESSEVCYFVRNEIVGSLRTEAGLPD